jgi:hypothetical protein
MTILCFPTNLSFFVNLGTRFLEEERAVTPWCYCSRYSIFIVASTVLIQCLLQYKSNSRKMVFFINEVGSFEVN